MDRTDRPTDGLVIADHRWPEPLTHLYALIGRRDDLLREPDRVYPPDELAANDGVVVFQEENQCVAFWAVPASGGRTRSVRAMGC